MRRAARLLAEACMLKGVDIGDVLVFAGNEVIVYIHSVGVPILEGLEPEGERSD